LYRALRENTANALIICTETDNLTRTTMRKHTQKHIKYPNTNKLVLVHLQNHTTLPWNSRALWHKIFNTCEKHAAMYVHFFADSGPDENMQRPLGTPLMKAHNTLEY